jgi:hypothetical protein
MGLDIGEKQQEQTDKPGGNAKTAINQKCMRCACACAYIAKIGIIK